MKLLLWSVFDSCTRRIVVTICLSDASLDLVVCENPIDWYVRQYVFT